MVREFSLLNEKDEEYSLMDIENYCLLTEPDGLGYSYTNTYEQIGNKFINSLKKLNQGIFNGQVNFLNYDNYLKLVDFIENSTKLKLKYTVPYKSGVQTYYRNVNLSSLGKTQLNINGILTEPMQIDFTSLWYKTEYTEYEIGSQEDEIRWGFIWDSRFLSNNSNVIDFNNEGHAPARLVIELEGYVVNPSFLIEQNGKELYNASINTTIEIGEKLVFSTLENEFYIKKINMITNEETNLYTLDNIDFDKDYILKLPVGYSTLSVITEDILNEAKINIYSYYKAV